MKDIPIKKFGSKLMVSSKSINKIPEEYLKLSENARIYDGGIGPRKGKKKLTESTLGTNNKGGFILNNKLYQITNSKIYEVDTVLGTQTEKVSLGYDIFTDILVYGNDFAIIVAEGQALKVFNGTTITTPSSIPAGDTGSIIEYTRGFSFYAINNILYISKAIDPDHPEYAYDFTGEGSQTITYDSNIKGLKGTMNGIYIFTEDKVEFLGANSLQNVAGAAAFISQPLGIGDEPINSLSIAASGDKIFYITKNLILNTINYISGTDSAMIGELSMTPVVSFREFMKNIDSEQPTGFAWYNQRDKSIQFNLRTNNFNYNNKVLYYDLINQTYNIDTGKNYNYVVKNGNKYYGFSDVNSNIAIDDEGYSDISQSIPFKIVTQNLNQGTILQKRYGGIFSAGGVGLLTTISYNTTVDGVSVFSDEISGNVLGEGSIEDGGLGEIGGNPTGGEPIGGPIDYESELQPFDRMADEGRILNDGTRIQTTITSNSQTQDFIIDIFGIRAIVTGNMDNKNKR